MKQIIEFYNKLNDQVRYAILVMVIFLIVLLDVLFLVVPQMNSIANDNDQIKKLSDDTQKVLVDRQRIGQLKKNLQEFQDQLSSLSVKVRPIQDVPAILSTISSIANEYGVKIDQLIPEKSQQEALTSAKDGNYYALPIVIKAHCGYHMFGHFLNKLENENLYFIMKDFIIQNEDNTPNTHLFSMTIKLILVDRAMNPSKNL